MEYRKSTNCSDSYFNAIGGSYINFYAKAYQLMAFGIFARRQIYLG
ncbi:MAG: hypothetical protein K2L52_00625 [Clostridia bacterium]|nr:hypothetical protein [Clostridia bacterium]